MPKKTEPKYPIDLGKKPSDLGMPMPSGMEGKSPESETIYPSLYLEWEKPYGFPDEGTMTVRFKKRSEENRKTGDKTMQRVELDIHEILDTKGTKEDSTEPEEDSGDVLDKEVKKITTKKTKTVEDDEENY
jgi:hypothetical protein